jgi:hypothetical protein
VGTATRKKQLTPEEIAERFGGPSAGDIRMIVRHIHKLDEARSDADRFRQLVEAFQTSKVTYPVRVVVPGPVEQGPKTLAEATRGWIIASVTAYWNDLGKHEKRATASSYARWRAKHKPRGGRPNPYIGRAALDSYVSGKLDRHTHGVPTEYDPDQDWRETVTVGKTTRLERPLEAALRVAGLT